MTGGEAFASDSITTWICNRLDQQPLSAPAAVASPVFTARQITKVYPMGEVVVHALRGVDFDLYASEFVVLLGPSGSGKSTLLNILGGLDIPTSGQVLYHDQDLTAADEAALTEYPTPACRVRLSVLQSDSQPHRA